MSPIILVGSGVVLFGLGLGLGLWFAHGQRMREATKASDIQNELDEYRRHVSEHFSETAQHFQMLGQQYQSLYKHIAQGAEALCDSAQSDALLGFAAGGAPAIAATTVDEAPFAPEVVKDYAPAEESELAPAELNALAESPETLAEITASDETLDEPAAEEAVADPVSPAISVEKERTVH